MFYRVSVKLDYDGLMVCFDIDIDKFGNGEYIVDIVY